MKNASSAIVLICLLGVASGWSVCSPRRIVKRSIRKGIQKGLIVGGAAVVAGAAGAVGAAVAFNQLNNREVYEPSPGSMIDQVVLVTGGSSGLGLETAKRLAAAGATVVLTSRSESKGSTAVNAVKDYLGGKGIEETSNVYSMSLDLDDLSNVRQFAASFGALKLGDISILINNAGVMAIPDRQLTVDGHERQFQSNHLGHFVLTAELFPYLSREGARVINVSSSASNLAAPGLDMDNLNGEKSYGAWPSYGASKLANILFARELQRRADAAGLDWLTTAALHPGVVNTDLWRYIVGEERLAELKAEEGGFGLESLAYRATSAFTLTPEEGASTQIFLAAAAGDDLSKGSFYEEMKEKTNLPSFATDDDKAKQLWTTSEELGGVIFDLTDIVDVALAGNAVAESPETPDAEESPIEGTSEDEDDM